MGTSNYFRSGMALVLFVAFSATAAAAQPFMHVGGLTTQPVGHYDFCQRKPDECQPTADANGPVELSRELWAEIVNVNNMVNLSVRPRTDMEMWGVEEYWSYPVGGYGDCEDYALEKRKRLMELGVPASSLLITVARQPNGDGHAVLVVNTSMGDFVLDNLEMRVLRWNETEYTYLKRQSARHAGMWVTITDDRDVLVGSVGSR